MSDTAWSLDPCAESEVVPHTAGCGPKMNKLTMRNKLKISDMIHSTLRVKRIKDTANRSRFYVTGIIKLQKENTEKQKK